LRSTQRTRTVDSFGYQRRTGGKVLTPHAFGEWMIFGSVVLAALTVDLFVVTPKSGDITLKRSIIESCGWIGLSLAFGGWIYISRGHQAGVEFFTAYVIEKSLSADNIFVMLVIFRTFNIEPRFQHRVLYSGVTGALVSRLVFVIVGIQLLQRFHFALYIFGAALVLFGVHMLLPGQAFRPEQNWLMRLVRKIHPVASSYKGEKFWVVEQGRRAATPLLLALVAIEAMDLIFAVDSVPAVLAVTRDPLIAYSSNVFAILGLRAMYFGLAEMMSRMRFLHQGLASILIFLGLKMLTAEHIPIPGYVSLGIILMVLLIASMASSLIRPRARS
jgi:tellurite resistance protein TerC